MSSQGEEEIPGNEYKQRKKPCEDTVTRFPPANQGEMPQEQ